MEEKLVAQARELVNKCKGRNGICASTQRYAAQCWTRDFGLAVAPLLLHSAATRDVCTVQRHLESLQSRQTPTGHLPTVFPDDEAEFIAHKEKQERDTGKTPFMLKAFRQGTLGDLTPHTRDAELLFLLVAKEPGLSVNEDSVHSAACYVQSLLKPPHYLVCGGDWRDIRDDLDDKPVLTNACLLYRVGQPDEANRVSKVLNDSYFNGNFYLDFPGASGPAAFDVLGNALAILWGIASPARAESIFQHATRVALPDYGDFRHTKFRCLHATRKKRRSWRETDVWSFHLWTPL